MEEMSFLTTKLAPPLGALKDITPEDSAAAI
jgi:hypothetical protein